jgi:hypothetical protein
MSASAPGVDPLIAEAKLRMRRRRAVMALAIVGVVAVAAFLTLRSGPPADKSKLTTSGNSSRPTKISLTVAATALRRAGFATWVVRHTEVDERIGEIDHIDVARPVNPSSPRTELAYFWPRAELVHFASSSIAAMVLKNAYSHAAMKRLEADWRRSPGTAKDGATSCGVGCIVGGIARPPGFAVRKVLGLQICNVVLWSFNAHNDPGLTARLRRAARFLRGTCSDSRRS